MKKHTVSFIKGVTGDDALLHGKLRQIAFVGRSNAGKSSVLNSLLGSGELARTGKKQGKTREINLFDVDGRYCFVDLPGYGFAKMTLTEREKTRQMIISYVTQKDPGAYTVALVVDAKVGLTDLDLDMLDILEGAGHHVVIVLNKTDKLNQKELAVAQRSVEHVAPRADIVSYSALHTHNPEVLFRALTEDRRK